MKKFKFWFVGGELLDVETTTEEDFLDYTSCDWTGEYYCCRVMGRLSLVKEAEELRFYNAITEADCNLLHRIAREAEKTITI